MTLRQKEMTYTLRGGLFEVQNEVGLGRSEEAYHRAFCIWMLKNNIAFQTKPIYPISLGNIHVFNLIPDLIVEEALVIELKAKPHRLAASDTVQLYNYMKRTGLSLGLLVNMGLDRVYIERHLRDSIETEFQNLNPSPSLCATTQKINESLCLIYEEHSTGYSSEIVDRILPVALSASEIKIEKKPAVEAFYNDHYLGKSTLDCLVINEDTVFCHSCLYNDNAFNCSRALSFMKVLNMRHGMAVNFGKRVLEVKCFQ